MDSSIEGPRANEEFIWSPPKVQGANEELTSNKKKMLIPRFEPGAPASGIEEK